VAETPSPPIDTAPGPPPNPIKRLGLWLDRHLKALDQWTRRLDRVAKFLGALGAIAVALGAIGLRSCLLPGPTPDPAGATIAPTSSPTDVAEATNTPVPSSSPVDPTPTIGPPPEPILRWVEEQIKGAVLDGSILTPGTDIWLEENYPDDPPRRFRVDAIVDPALAPALGDALSGPLFPARTKPGFIAQSDRPWKLPQPPPSSGSISYRFHDNFGNRSGPVTVATFASVTAQLKAGGSGKLPTLTMNIDGELRVELDAGFVDSADVGVVILAPWNSGESGLREFVRTYYNEVTRDPEVAEDATRRFFADYGEELPEGQPDGWSIGAETGAFSGETGDRVRFALTGVAPSAGTTLLAVKLVDQNDPSRVAVSRIFRVNAVGPDVAPEITVLSPETFATGTTLRLNSVDDALFADVQLQANVSDADGPIPDESIVWTTDRGDLQPNGEVLATGEFGIVSLYAADCSGATHVVTLTVDDGTGHTVTETGTIELRCDD
jgi:hypothetical protein